MNNVESVRDIVEYLNQRDLRDPLSEAHHDRPLHIDDEGIYANYAGFRLGSLFQPIVDLGGEDGCVIVAHEAFLAAHTTKGLASLGNAFSPESIFSSQASSRDITTLDRLARTLHALNFLLQDVVEPLHLNVHPNHLLAVSTDHGQVFEKILRQCGLDPTTIVLEIPEYGIRDKKKLRAAVQSWQAHGYRIAIDRVGCGHTQLDRILELDPNIVKLDQSLVQRLPARPRERDALHVFSEKCRQREVQIIASGVETPTQQELVQSIGIQRMQGYLFGRPAAQCLPSAQALLTANPAEKLYA